MPNLWIHVYWIFIPFSERNHIEFPQLQLHFVCTVDVTGQNCIQQEKSKRKEALPTVRFETSKRYCSIVNRLSTSVFSKRNQERIDFSLRYEAVK